MYRITQDNTQVSQSYDVAGVGPNANEGVEEKSGSKQAYEGGEPPVNPDLEAAEPGAEDPTPDASEP